MKRIVICLDGTWQTLSQSDITNIGIIARSVAHKETRPDGSHIYQNVIYAQGVGSTIGGTVGRDWAARTFGSLTRTLGGAFGEGLDDLILDTYLRLCFDYEDGDQIFLFGFSRGAFAARRLAGLVNRIGIVSRLHTDKALVGYQLYLDQPNDDASDDAKKQFAESCRAFRFEYGKGRRRPDGTREQLDTVPPIQYIGIFDTVAQRGVHEVIASFTPWNDSKRFRFTNYHVPDCVQLARHACAVDENRLGFPPLLWENIDEANAKRGATDAVQQRWFAGQHGDIGGGIGSKLSAVALKWIADGAVAAGLRFYGSYGKDHSPIDDALANAGLALQSRISRPAFWEGFEPFNYGWRGRKIWSNREAPTSQDLTKYLHPSVLERAHQRKPRYNPAPLRPFSKAMKSWKPPSDHA
ncbi:MAG: DUF2235 domain-containing protein [Terricaulis sp.]